MRKGIHSDPAFHKKPMMLFLYALLVLFVFADVVHAHKVTIFAWIEGDTVHTQSKFSGGKRAKNSQVIVYDLGENQLLEGKTDDNGEFSFKVPPQSASGLRIVLNASMGHMAEWVIPADEMNDAELSNVAPSEASAQPEMLQHTSSAYSDLTPSFVKNQTKAVKNCNCQNIEKIIDTALDKKLAPMMDMLIQLLDPKPTMRDIIGGIGYIMGLVGLTMYFIARKKED